VALDPDYQWAIITGGPPTQVGLDGTCRTGTGQNDSGFWLFSRKPVDPENTEIMLEVAREELGLDLSVLLPVQQEGCTYP
jgi:apolipoprotein D and lipocalin family protein